MAVVLAAWPGAASAAPPPRAPLPFGCVPALVDVRPGSSIKGYASHYVSAGTFAYGEWRAGSYGGQSLWKRSGTTWCKVATGVTVLDRRALLAFGIPAPVAQRLLATMRATHELAPPIARTSRTPRVAQRATKR
ncbi:MAG: hypothetical protein NVSMB19_07220 [Vulcanimicrobiaceae bacterium]